MRISFTIFVAGCRCPDGYPFRCHGRMRCRSALQAGHLNAKKEDITIMHSPVGMPSRAIHNPFLTERANRNGKNLTLLPVPQKKCDKASIPCCYHCLTPRCRWRYRQRSSFLRGNAWRLDHMTTVPELMAELVGGIPCRTAKIKKFSSDFSLSNNVTMLLYGVSIKSLQELTIKTQKFL